MFPNAGRLRHLLNYLSIKPSADIITLEDVQAMDTLVDRSGLSGDALHKIAIFRSTAYRGRKFQQIGLFEFHVGLIFMYYQWFSESAECFEKAYNQWSYLPERPHLCLAHFAYGVAQHRNGRFDVAKDTYSEVGKMVEGIRAEVSMPSAIPQIKAYQEFVTYLIAQLEEAQKTAVHDILHDPSPRIHPSLQSGMRRDSSDQSLEIEQAGLRRYIQEHFNIGELQALCFDLKIDYDGLSGEGVGNKVRELVAYCLRHRRILDLIRDLSRRRPSIKWQDFVLTPLPEGVVAGVVLEPAEENLKEGQRWFQVGRKGDNFLPTIDSEDWLIVETAQEEESLLRPRELVVIGGGILGSVPVQSKVEADGAGNEADQGLFLAEFVRNTTTGEVLVSVSGENNPIKLNRHNIHGRVVRRCQDL
jgi:hypothetical protein